MKIYEIIDIIETTAPLAQQAAWDASGMQVAALQVEVEHLALCLDPTPEHVETALAQGARMVISHHPLLMQARLPAVPDHFHAVLSLLFRHDAALYAAHTSLDVNPRGPAGWLAHALELRHLDILERTGVLPDGQTYGFGGVGELPLPLDMPTLLQRLGQSIALETATLCGPMPQSIRRVAWCTGSGASLMTAAHAAGADVFITGDVKYHMALEAPLCVLDVGHHSLEEEMMRRFAHELEQTLPAVRVSFVASASPLRPACPPHTETLF